jgi:hypothetical protein
MALDASRDAPTMHRIACLFDVFARDGAGVTLLGEVHAKAPLATSEVEGDRAKQDQVSLLSALFETVPIPHRRVRKLTKHTLCPDE